MSLGWQYTQVGYVEESGVWRGSKWVLKMYDPVGERFVPLQPQPEHEIVLLNLLGRQGWELVTIPELHGNAAGDAGAPDRTRTWFFKRPIPE